MSPKLEFRNHLLAAGMDGRWETIEQIINAVQKKYGNRYAHIDAHAILRQLASDGIHHLGTRVTKKYFGISKVEYRLFVKAENVADTERYARPRTVRTRRADHA
jgi:hypothetical protein